MAQGWVVPARGDIQWQKNNMVTYSSSFEIKQSGMGSTLVSSS